MSDDNCPEPSDELTDAEVCYKIDEDIAVAWLLVKGQVGLDWDEEQEELAHNTFILGWCRGYRWYAQNLDTRRGHDL